MYPNRSPSPSPNPEPNPNLSGERPTRGSRVEPPSVLSGEVLGLAAGLAAPVRGRTLARRGEKAASLVSGRVRGGRGRMAATCDKEALPLVPGREAGGLIRVRVRVRMGRP